MYPFTINGRTYNEADFQGPSYAQKFGQLAYDLSQYRVNPSNTTHSQVATSISSVSYGTGTKVFTIAAGKAFFSGMPLIMVGGAEGAYGTMYGRVASYVGTTLTVTVELRGPSEAGTDSEWLIYAGYTPVHLDDFTFEQGGTGQTTAEDVFTLLPELPHYDLRPETIEDFIISETFLQSSTQVSTSRILGVTLGGGKVNTLGAMTNAAAAGIPNLSQHPGLCELTVALDNSTATVMLYKLGTTPPKEGAVMRGQIFIPEWEAGSEGFELWVGWGSNEGGSPNSFSVNITGFTVPQGSWSVVDLNTVTNTSKLWAMEAETEFLGDEPPSGAWVTFELRRSGGSIFATFSGSSEINASYDYTGFPEFEQLQTPFVRLRKLGGNSKTYTAYVDWLYDGYESSITR